MRCNCIDRHDVIKSIEKYKKICCVCESMKSASDEVTYTCGFCKLCNSISQDLGLNKEE